MILEVGVLLQEELLQKWITDRINDVGKVIYRRSTTLDGWQFKRGYYDAPDQYRYEDQEWAPIKVGQQWGSPEQTYWFRKMVRIPDTYKGCKVIMSIELGGGEALLSINGMPYQGIDRNHKSVVLTEHAAGDEQYDILIEAGMEWGEYAGRQLRGLPFEPYTFRGVTLACVNETAYEYYFDLKTIFDSAVVQNDNDLRQSMLNKVKASLQSIDDYNDDEQIKKARTMLCDSISAIRYARGNGKLLLNGHSHIDTAWLWPLKETVRKCGRTFSTALRLMEQYPQYYFIQSQAQQFEYTKQYYPKLYEQIKTRIKEGRWEPTGGTWVEHDCNLISGESFVRQILLGKRFFMQEFGIEPKVAWLPDTFGFNWIIPQILKKGGYEYFVTNKIMWIYENKFPYDLFTWRGNDGSEILSYFPTSPGGYNGMLTPNEIKATWDNFRQKEQTDELLYQFGYGDGGGGPTAEMLEYAKRLTDLPGMPECTTGRADEYFERLRNDIDALPVWDGELYFELHRGTYTTQARNKRNNRKAELLYREAELLSYLARMYGHPYEQETLNNGWKKILLNQFHDIIPGSSITPVYEDSAKDYAEVLRTGNDIKSKALKNLESHIDTSGDGKAITVFNSLSWPVTAMVSIAAESDKKYKVIDRDGNIVDSQTITEEGRTELVFTAVDVPSMGYKVYHMIEEESVPAVVDITVEREHLENRFFAIDINEKGFITSIYDKINGRQVLQPDRCGNVLQIFEDKPANWEAWDIDISYRDKMWEVDDMISSEIMVAGPVKGVLRITKRFNKSTIIQDITIYSDIPRIDFKTSVDWQEDQKLLKVAFPVDIRATEATYDIYYGAINRPTHWNTSWDKAKFEVCAHKWADLSEGDYGVSLLNDCKYGHDIKDNVMRLTLLRAPMWPDPKADRGYHEFTYSLYPHKGSWNQGGTVPMAWQLNAPLTAIAASPHTGSLAAEQSLFSVDADNVIIDTVKKAEDNGDLILRVFEALGQRGRVGIKCAFNVQSAVECDLLERAQGEDIPVQAGSFDVYIKPYELKTFRLKL